MSNRDINVTRLLNNLYLAIVVDQEKIWASFQVILDALASRHFPPSPHHFTSKPDTLAAMTKTMNSQLKQQQHALASNTIIAIDSDDEGDRKPLGVKNPPFISLLESDLGWAEEWMNAMIIVLISPRLRIELWPSNCRDRRACEPRRWE